MDASQGPSAGSNLIGTEASPPLATYMYLPDIHIQFKQKQYSIIVPKHSLENVFSKNVQYIFFPKSMVKNILAATCNFINQSC